MSVIMPEVQKGRPPRDWASRIQIHGTLLKKPFGHSSNKWTKRFFLVKDGFLMYYADNEKKEYEKREFFNIHPKGIVPLGECHITPLQEPGHPFCLKLESHEIDGTLLLAAETEHERNKWQEIMERSRRVTWRNTHLSAEMIRQLENEGLLMAREKQDYFDRLQTEAQALSEERLRADQLEQINQELEVEKKKLESFTAEMQEEYEKIRGELEETVQVMNEIEQERDNLNTTLQERSCQLKSLADDKEVVLKELQEREAMASQLSKEKRHLSETTDELQQRLLEIEKQTDLIKQEKKQAQERLFEQLERLHDLEEEKATISEHAHDLQSTIQDLKAQKEMTEKELREEIRARLSAEQQLKEAETSLKHLECAVQNQTPNIEADIKEEMTVNVKKLKQFFEELAADSKISSEKPLIIRNRLTARKTLARRAKTIKYETRRQTSSENEEETELRSTSCLDGESRPRQQLRRAVTSVGPGTACKTVLSLPASPRDKIVYEEEEHL
ncbi:pleckstrin homology domain-containing family D member 1-like isoform X3 [Pomacea canaliculata]|uniref:pleckstrin homology domain-containing family D member 1-like isoform X3 n=1 Tax=Pomacea canaliculata TaxID=400727 RepID=UPI000D73CAB2|nr:pleckstrin homology domain-containing family D member 1-like isoform X3 [Pomacea canaliculata]